MGHLVFAIIFFSYAYLIREIYLELKKDGFATKYLYWQATILHLATLIIYIAAEADTMYAIRSTGDFNWGGSDQTYIFDCMRGILKNFKTPNRFPIGVQGIIYPILAIFNPSGVSSTNWKLVPFFLFLLIPLGYLSLLQLSTKLTGSLKRGQWVWVVMFVLTLLYCLVPVDWMQGRYSQFGARRVLMLVFGAEVFSFPLILYSWVCLFKPLTKKSVCLLGMISALLLMNSERNLSFVGLIAMMLLVKEFKYIPRWLVATLVTYTPQLVYQIYNFGWGFGASRAHYWLHSKRSEVWSERVGLLYKNKLSLPLKQISIEYVHDNIFRFLSWWVYWLAAACAAFLMYRVCQTYRDKTKWAEGTFMLALAGIISAQMLLALVYINPDVNYRYFASTIPVIALTVTLFFTPKQSQLKL